MTCSHTLQLLHVGNTIGLNSSVCCSLFVQSNSSPEDADPPRGNMSVSTRGMLVARYCWDKGGIALVIVVLSDGNPLSPNQNKEAYFVRWGSGVKRE